MTANRQLRSHVRVCAPYRFSWPESHRPDRPRPTQQSQLESFFSNYGGVVTKSDDCVLSNARLVQEFAKLPGARPAAFERLLKAARAAEAKGGALDGG
jgi:hypothetical protein